MKRPWGTKDHPKTKRQGGLKPKKGYESKSWEASYIDKMEKLIAKWEAARLSASRDCHRLLRGREILKKKRKKLESRGPGQELEG